jgi:hypothetical protein
VFVATNTLGGGALTGELASGLVRRFYAAPPRPPLPDPGLLRQAAVYQGEFISARRAFHGLEAFAVGFLATPVSVAAPGYLTVGGSRFVPTGAPGLFRHVDYPDVQLQAVMQDGRAVRLLWGSDELERRPFLRRTQTIGYAAGATALAALAVLIGLFSPARWRAPQTTVQRWAGRLRGLAAALWLTAMFGFATKLAQGVSDNATVVFDWPGSQIVLASSAALAAAVLSLATAAMTPWALRGSSGWTTARKVRFTVTVAVFAAFALLTGYLGALQPWNP